jgi:glycosyltransferase involved in cell wall biosynthesis
VAPSASLPGTLWLQTAAGPAARRAGADAFFGCLGIVPLAGGPPSVATVHDVTPLLFPEWHSFKNRMGFTPFIGGSVRAARRIAAVSEHSRRDLVQHFPDAAAKTSVVHNGVETCPAPVGGPAPNEGRPYVLSLGTLEPRKNLSCLVEAMESIWDRRPGFPDLVLAGTEGWGLRGFAGRIASSRHAARIRLAGYLEGGERSRWMAGARVFAYPSLYEGFGLPPLEAMALGTPVVASSASSLPEVVGDAGLLPDPKDAAAIAAAIERAHDDEAFRRWAAAKGPARAATFTWASSARKMRALFEEALS